MDPYRFYLPDLPAKGYYDQEIPFPETEAHHARSVLRLQPDEPILLFNGTGRRASGLLTRVDKKGVWAKLVDPPTQDPPLSPALVLATALPKGERAEWLVEQASQLGVAALQFLDCQRSVVKPREGGQKIEKWKRLAVESAKQCGRTHLLEIHDALELSRLRSAVYLLGKDRPEILRLLGQNAS